VGSIAVLVIFIEEKVIEYRTNLLVSDKAGLGDLITILSLGIAIVLNFPFEHHVSGTGRKIRLFRSWLILVLGMRFFLLYTASNDYM